MKNTIKKLAKKIESADVNSVTGRGEMVRACKELYHEIEEDLIDNQLMVEMAYHDLCNGNFSKPYACEMKKEAVKNLLSIYETQIVPNL